MLLCAALNTDTIVETVSRVIESNSNAQRVADADAIQREKSKKEHEKKVEQLHNIKYSPLYRCNVIRRHLKKIKREKKRQNKEHKSKRKGDYNKPIQLHK